VRFSDRHSSEDEQLPKVLFYSVLLHYTLVYLFFGNPFLLLNRDDEPPGFTQNFEVKLLNFPTSSAMNGSDENKALVARALDKDRFDPVTQATIPTTRISGRKESGDLENDEKVEVPNSERDTKSEDGSQDPIKDLQSPQHVSERNLSPEMPPSMTGPEDCMLKLVGMVCPQGKVGCITAYTAFCASLPK